MMSEVIRPEPRSAFVQRGPDAGAGIVQRVIAVTARRGVLAHLGGEVVAVALMALGPLPSNVSERVAP